MEITVTMLAAGVAALRDANAQGAEAGDVAAQVYQAMVDARDGRIARMPPPASNRALLGLALVLTDKMTGQIDRAEAIRRIGALLDEADSERGKNAH